MTSPADVAAFHAEFDRHADDRIRLFAALQDLVPSNATVLYPGSYVDIGPSISFDDVTYVDTDERAARFFAQQSKVSNLMMDKRARTANGSTTSPQFAFHQLDYRTDLPIPVGSAELLISLYAGFVSEHCSRYLQPGGLILVNSSHGDTAMASLDPRNRLVAVIQSRNGDYRTVTDGLDDYLIPKRDRQPTIAELHSSGRGIAYTKPAFAYIFQRG